MIKTISDFFADSIYAADFIYIKNLKTSLQEFVSQDIWNSFAIDGESNFNLNLYLKLTCL